MKNFLVIFSLVICALLFAQCKDHFDSLNNNPSQSSGSPINVTVQASAIPLLKDGDDDDDPEPMFEITGNVSDGFGNPIEASVELSENPGNNLINSTLTNSNGDFIFNNVMTGSYNIVVFVDGSVLDTINVTI